MPLKPLTVKSLQSLDKIPLVWLQAMTCNGNTHALLSMHTPLVERFSRLVTMVYHPMMCGTQADLKHLKSPFILIVEGTLPSQPQENFCAGLDSQELITMMVKRADLVIALGSCASFGGVHKEGIYEGHGLVTSPLLGEFSKKLVALSGCPANPEWLVRLMGMIKQGYMIERDEFFRPKVLYSTTVHEGCSRNEYFEWKIDAKGFGTHKGCLFYDQGCRGPMTHASCNTLLWNGVASKTRVGVPCLGCTEPDFPRNGMLSTPKNMGLPAVLPLGVSKRAYFAMAGIAKTFKHGRLGES